MVKIKPIVQGILCTKNLTDMYLKITNKHLCITNYQILTINLNK